MTHHHRVAGVVWALVTGTLVTALAADDWPQFRGPGGDGISTAKNLPLTWSATTNVLWKTAVPGRGRSSPVVLGDRIWLTTAIETNPRTTRQQNDPVTAADRVEIGVVCLDRATGRQLYHVTLFRADNPPVAHVLNSFATPTPVVEPGRLYCDFGAFGTVCLDADTGKTLWQRQLVIDHQLAPGSSPALCKDLLILVRDGRDQQYVTALDKRAGQTVWKTDRPPLAATIGNLKKSFSTPTIVESAGRAQIVVPGAQWIVSYDPATGRELWRVEHGRGFSIAARAVAGHGMVYACTGMTRQLWAIRADGQGDVTKTHVAWKVESGLPMLSSPLLLGKEIYAITDKGVAICWDALSGQELGRQRVGGEFGASPLYADGRIYVFDQAARTTVLKAGKAIEVLAVNELNGMLFASPAAVGDKLYVRTDTHLYCVGRQ